MSILITTVIYKNYIISYQRISHKLHSKFKISRGTKSTVKTLFILAKKNDYTGCGECVEYKRYNENLKDITSYIKKTLVINDISKIKSLSLQAALQNALLDVKIQKSTKNYLSFFKLKKRYETFITLPIQSIQEIKIKKNIIRKLKLIKIKLNEKNILKILNLIKFFNSKAKIIIDANEGWSFQFLKKNIKKLESFNILFIEQPLKAGEQKKLKKVKTKIPFCADEDFYHNKKLDYNVYKWVNLKVDKFGCDQNIFSAIRLCKKYKLNIMLGCMVSSSLSIIPILRYAKYSKVLDLDGAKFLKKDYKNKIKYKNNFIYLNSFFAWGKKKARQKTGL